jgi:hypothetical protein
MRESERCHLEVLALILFSLSDYQVRLNKVNANDSQTPAYPAYKRPTIDVYHAFNASGRLKCIHFMIYGSSYMYFSLNISQSRRSSFLKVKETDMDVPGLQRMSSSDWRKLNILHNKSTHLLKRELNLHWSCNESGSWE